MGDLGRRLCGGEEPGEGEGVSLVMVGEEYEASGGGEEREGTEGQVLCGQSGCLAGQSCGGRQRWGRRLEAGEGGRNKQWIILWT